MSKAERTDSKEPVNYSAQVELQKLVNEQTITKDNNETKIWVAFIICLALVVLVYVIVSMIVPENPSTCFRKCVEQRECSKAKDEETCRKEAQNLCAPLCAPEGNKTKASAQESSGTEKEPE